MILHMQSLVSGICEEMGTNKKGPRRSLMAGRPPTIKKGKSISRKATKALINNHHQLDKKRQQAIARGDEAAEAAARQEIQDLGGLGIYQQASLQGQRTDRGGDSSKILMEWLKPVTLELKPRPIQMLEVGALSIDNACSRSKCFEIERIDLHSQGVGILEQDFMERPLPESDEGRFDIISLSLVLNFVPDHKNRGDMLIRTLEFLREPMSTSESPLDTYFPSLFLVLPEPCVSNSRYLDHSRLQSIMESLGYEEVKSKVTRRLVYYLYKRTTAKPRLIRNYSKKEIRPGRSRNNFSIVLQPP